MLIRHVKPREIWWPHPNIFSLKDSGKTKQGDFPLTGNYKEIDRMSRAK